MFPSFSVNYYSETPRTVSKCLNKQNSISCPTAALVALLLVAAFASWCPKTAALMAECTAQEHCGPLQCCRLSGFRYSVPVCSPRGQEGDWCRPNSEPLFRTSLQYPGGKELEVEEVFHVLCPCAPGLLCSADTATCHPVQPTSYY